MPVIIGAAVGGTTGGVIAMNNGQSFWKGFTIGAIAGAGAGAITATAVGATGNTTAAGTLSKGWGIATIAIQGAI